MAGTSEKMNQRVSVVRYNALLAACLVGCLVGYLAAFPAVVAAGIEDGARHIEHPDWMSPAFVDLDADLERVRETGKTGVMVLFTTQGCSYCAEFIAKSLHDPTLRQRVQDNFAAIGLEIFDDVLMTDHRGDDVPIKAFAESQGAGMAPTLLFYGPDHDLIFRAVGYQSPERFGHILDYLVGGSHRDIGFRDYLARVGGDTVDPAAYPTLEEDPLFMEPPFALARRPVAADRPMLVLFERPGCVACLRFHEQVLALGEVRERLGAFEVVRLDVTDTTTPVLAPDGSRTTPASWYADSGLSRLPAMLFVDESGETVFSNDAVTERNRMLNMMGLVLERRYADGWTYQRYARSQAIERNRRQQAGQ
jgi:thioredoxin-related protein